MSDVLAQSVRVTLDQTYYLAACDSALATRMGAIINYLLSHQQNRPVGSTLQSILDEATFQSLRGSNWVLCNGQSCSGSAYQTLTGNASVPDTRSSCLRGKNNGRSDGYQNPDGDLSLGAFQNHEMSSHTHTISFSNNLGVGSGTGIEGDQSGPGSARLRAWQEPRATVTLGGPTNMSGTSVTSGENRPRNITVNTFIRIN